MGLICSRKAKCLGFILDIWRVISRIAQRLGFMCGCVYTCVSMCEGKRNRDRESLTA